MKNSPSVIVAWLCLFVAIDAINLSDVFAHQPALTTVPRSLLWDSHGVFEYTILVESVEHIRLQGFRRERNPNAQHVIYSVSMDME